MASPQFLACLMICTFVSLSSFVIAISLVSFNIAPSSAAATPLLSSSSYYHHMTFDSNGKASSSSSPQLNTEATGTQLHAEESAALQRLESMYYRTGGNETLVTLTTPTGTNGSVVTVTEAASSSMQPI